MKRNANNGFNLIEVNEFVLDAAMEGFDLLNLHKRAYPDTLYPKHLIHFWNPNEIRSTNSLGRSKEPYEWLRDVVKFILQPTIVNQNIIEDSADLFNVLNSLSDDSKEEYSCYFTDQMQFFARLNDVNIDQDIDEDYEYNELTDIPEYIIDEYLYAYPFRVTTIAHKLFDTNIDLALQISSDLPILFADELNLNFDLFDSVTVIDNQLNSYHPTSDFNTTITIITRAGTAFTSHDISDSYPDGYTNRKPLYLNSLKEACRDLLK